MLNGYIYMIENQINHKKYIGQTIKEINERFKRHEYLKWILFT